MSGFVSIVIPFASGVDRIALVADGIFATIAPHALTPFPSEVTDTAHLVSVLIRTIDGVSYARSGKLVGSNGRLSAMILSATSVLDTTAGASPACRSLFSVLLAVRVALTGVSLLYGRTRGLSSFTNIDVSTDGEESSSRPSSRHSVPRLDLSATSNPTRLPTPVTLPSRKLRAADSVSF